jgi:hypothetical protein
MGQLEEKGPKINGKITPGAGSTTIDALFFDR